MEHKDSFKNKASSNAVATHSDVRRNIPRGISFAITLSYSTYSINPYPVNCGENGELLIMPANGRWDLIQRLKG
jgi:hypothetical protein